MQRTKIQVLFFRLFSLIKCKRLLPENYYYNNFGLKSTRKMQKLSLARAKQIKALHQKKIREETNLFLVEGLKPVLELLSSNWKIESIVASDSFYGDYQKNLLEFGDRVFVCSADELSQISTFKTNTKVLAVVSQKQVSSIGPDQMADFWLVLGNV